MNYALIIKIAIYVVALVASGFGALLVFNILRKAETGTEKAIASIDDRYKRNGGMTEEKLKLSRLGIMYRFGDYNLNPSKYVTLRLISSLVCTVLLFALGMGPLALIGLPLGYLLVNILFIFLNSRDELDMSKDIYSTYANLKIQLTSGIYLADCLEYTYNIVQNERYKEALRELVLNFSDKTMTSNEAISIFKNRFESKQINKLCSMMSTFVQYGISEAYVNDIMVELQSVLSADTLKAEHDIESKTGFITFILFGLIVGLVFIAMMGTFNGIDIFSM